MKPYMPALCDLCTYYKPGLGEPDGVSKCDAYPQGIPKAILVGNGPSGTSVPEPHFEPEPGQIVAFRKRDDVTDEEVEQWRQLNVEAHAHDQWLGDAAEAGLDRSDAELMFEEARQERTKT